MPTPHLSSLIFHPNSPNVQECQSDFAEIAAPNCQSRVLISAVSDNHSIEIVERNQWIR
jgi:hypothetical protein